MKPGIYTDLTNEQYHGGEGTSKSGLDIVERSLAHMRHALEMREAGAVREPTAAQEFGTAVHAAILEPDLFERDYVRDISRADFQEAISDKSELVKIIEKINEGRLEKLKKPKAKSDKISAILGAEPTLASGQLMDETGIGLDSIIDTLNENRPGHLATSGTADALREILSSEGISVQWWPSIVAEFNAKSIASGKKILPAQMYDNVCSIAEACRNHKMVSKLIDHKKGAAERSVYWQDEKTGLLCRCRPDFWNDALNVLVDVKTTEDASPRGFAKSVEKWRYDVQAPYYLDGVEAATGKRPRSFIFVAVEKTAPFLIGVYALPPEVLALGKMQYRKNLQDYAEAIETGVWPGYSPDILPLEMPGYYFQKLETIMRTEEA